MLRFGIVGFGRHAVKRLMPGFALSKRCKVTALSRRDIRQARRSAEQFGVAHAFDSTGALCASPEVDAVFVTSPDAMHCADTLTALRHGKPVLCEKPMAMNADECLLMVAASKAAGKLLGVAHIFRFEESVARARKMVEEGGLGRIVHARLEFHYPAVNHPRTWITDPSLAAGGPMADVGVHCIDALRYILRDEVRAVSAVAVADKDSGAVESAGVMTLAFAGGALGTVSVSTRAAYRTPLEIVGSDGTLRADDFLNVETPIELIWTANDGSESREEAANQLAYARQVDAFAAAVLDGDEFPATGEDGLRNQLVLDAAYRSWRSGKLEEVGQS